jgi:cysteinyl-tRNA synthetase
MTIFLHNTLTRSKEAFVPIDASNVRTYVCGPTVYDDAHIGNARPVVVFDILNRLLRHVYGDANVVYVRNVTDVDDKINKRAAADYPGMPLNEAIRMLTAKTEARFVADTHALSCIDPTFQPRATDNIAQMQAIISGLLARGHAYLAGGEVLFSVPSMPSYGSLSGRDLSAHRNGARVAVDGHKRDPSDFVLWKASSTNEPGWESPWGFGRPGWHIECSAMSSRYLGDVFDIHGGGHDLIFPHHENEIAQSCCANGTDRMANYWLHNGFLLINGRKMSKSEGNFYTVRQLLETDDFGGRKWSGDILRLALLLTPYREPLDFTAAKLEEAGNLIARWPDTVETEAAPDAEVVAHLCDDLNTVRALQALHALSLRARKSEDGLEAFSATAALLGVGRVQYKPGASLTHHVEARVASRLESLARRDFAAADAVRADLALIGVALADGKDTTTGQRTTRWSIADQVAARSYERGPRALSKGN